MNKKNWIWMVVAIAVVIVGIYIYKSQNKEKTDDNVIKIGAILPLTGKLSDAGNTVLAGLRFAIDSVNKSSKYKYELFVNDTKSETSQAVSGYKKLVTTDGVKIIFTTTTAHVMAIKPQCIKDSVILFGIASHPDVTKDGNGFIFRPNNSSIEESDIIAEMIKGKFNYNNSIAIFYPNSDFGIAFLNQFKNKLNNYKNIFESPYEEDPSSIKNVILKVDNINKISCSIVIGFTPIMGGLIRNLEEYNFKGSVLANTGFYNPTILNSAGSAANGVYYVDYEFPYDQNIELEQASIKKYNVHFSALSYFSYFSLLVIDKAINKSSSKNGDISNYLKNMGEVDIKGLKFIAFPDGNIKPRLVIKEYEVN